MKRKASSSDLIKQEKLRELKRKNQCIALSETFKKNLYNKIDQTITLSNRNDPSIKIYYPISAFLFGVKEIEPQKLTMKSFYSNQYSRYIDYICFDYIIDDTDIIKKLFGKNTFNTRNYSDSKGFVDFGECKGGILEIEISKGKPFKIHYDSYFEEMTPTSFFYWKKKYVFENGQMILNYYLNYCKEWVIKIDCNYNILINLLLINIFFNVIINNVTNSNYHSFSSDLWRVQHI